MRKDKAWLKEEIKKLITEESQFMLHAEMVDLGLVLLSIDELDEPEKPVIPQFIANFIEKWKDQGLAMYEWFSFDFDNKEDEEVNKWLYDNDCEENTRREYLLIDAVRYGYEVEKEPQWVVLRNCMYIKNFYFGEMNNDYRVGSIAYKEQAMLFNEKDKAEAVALLVDGEVEEVTE